MLYRVRWEIDVEAGTPQEAAVEARMAQLRPGTHALVFDIRPSTPADGPWVTVDLLALDGEAAQP